jgi:hypothetical protein
VRFFHHCANKNVKKTAWLSDFLPFVFCFRIDIEFARIALSTDDHAQTRKKSLKKVCKFEQFSKLFSKITPQKSIDDKFDF